jgi:hypothetical protein
MRASFTLVSLLLSVSLAGRAHASSSGARSEASPRPGKAAKEVALKLLREDVQKVATLAPTRLKAKWENHGTESWDSGYLRIDADSTREAKKQLETTQEILRAFGEKFGRPGLGELRLRWKLARLRRRIERRAERFTSRSEAQERGRTLYDEAKASAERKGAQATPGSRSER